MLVELSEWQLATLWKAAQEGRSSVTARVKTEDPDGRMRVVHVGFRSEG